MRITPIGISNSIEGVTSAAASPSKHSVSPGSDPLDSFGEAIKKAVGEVNHLQAQADKMAVGLASGEIQDVHQAMIAMNKAKLALDFTIQVRNKVIEAYQEIMRMQV